MIWLLLSITTSSLLYVIFKYFQVFKVNRLHAIVVNYLVACVTGFLAYGELPTINEVWTADWLIYAMGLGALFIFIFNVMALTSQKNGLSVAAVAGKMSLVIPVIAGFWLYGESMGWIKLIGIFIALASVYLTSIKSKNGITWNRELLLLPLLLFVGSGVIDTTIKYAEQVHVPEGLEPLFSAICFMSAFAIGILVMIYESIQGRPLQWKSIVAGAVLGIPNYFSIYFLIRALKTGMESSVVYPINHVGTVLLTSFLGIIIFKEKLILKNYIGIAIAVVAIIMIAFAKA
ncbi:EamA family transporter [Nonlabens xiamenensis]|uniref:EamA family transporter n=1 Tax=Nonlabens xiamenensis TaxID=2341043 RepID=UPI000F6127B1|nr:EamA family transporter [Nonlabens xiamenensis]